MSDKDLVILRDNLDPTEAHILRARLQVEGIPTFLVGDQHVQTDWTVAIALGGVRLQVRRVDQVKAGGILAAIDRGEYDLEEADFDAHD